MTPNVFRNPMNSSIKDCFFGDVDFSDIPETAKMLYKSLDRTTRADALVISEGDYLKGAIALRLIVGVCPSRE
jgi:hypothetical protein